MINPKILTIDKSQKIKIDSEPKKLITIEKPYKLSVEDQSKKLVAVEKPYKLSVEDQSKKLVVREEKKIVHLIAQQGLPGVPGDGTNFICEEEIDFGDILYFKPNGRLYKASYNSVDLISNFVISFFMAQGSSTTPGETIFCRFHGKVTFLSPIFTPNTVYYLGENGKLTNIPPTTGLMLVIGSAITETDFFVNIQQPILLR